MMNEHIIKIYQLSHQRKVPQSQLLANTSKRVFGNQVNEQSMFLADVTSTRLK